MSAFLFFWGAVEPADLDAETSGQLLGNPNGLLQSSTPTRPRTRAPGSGIPLSRPLLLSDRALQCPPPWSPAQCRVGRLVGLLVGCA